MDKHVPWGALVYSSTILIHYSDQSNCMYVVFPRDCHEQTIKVRSSVAKRGTPQLTWANDFVAVAQIHVNYRTPLGGVHSKLA